MPFHLAQLVFLLSWSAVDVGLILLSCISLAKILYVTQFDLIFSQDQESMGRIILGVSLLIGCTPHLLIYAQRSATNQVLASGVAYFMGDQMVDEGIGPLLICGAFWLFLSGILLAFAILFIRNYEQRHHLNQPSEGMEESAGKSVRLPRVLLCVTVMSAAVIVGIIIQVYGLNVKGQFPVMMPLYAILLYIYLIYLALNENVVTFSTNIWAEKWSRMKVFWRNFCGCMPQRINPA